MPCRSLKYGPETLHPFYQDQEESSSCLCLASGRQMRILDVFRSPHNTHVPIASVEEKSSQVLSAVRQCDPKRRRGVPSDSIRQHLFISLGRQRDTIQSCTLLPISASMQGEKKSKQCPRVQVPPVSTYLTACFIAPFASHRPSFHIILPYQCIKDNSPKHGHNRETRESFCQGR